MKKVITAALVSFALSGCYSFGNQTLKNVTQEDVKAKIVKGKTTKSEVLTAFGEPDKRIASDNEEKWSYSMHNYRSKPTSYIPLVGVLIGGTDIEEKSILITFKGEKVSSYEFSAGASEIKHGAF
ncbi:hypothetical protein EXT68_03715 [Pectobacterium parmentieri]|uniref:11.6 kDa putative exported protein n=1 Tax=Pectobacterium parmentieri TaxID=1905730 RepID=A0A0H3I5B7_PECPM|nr:hypothetical protein [Pectobacterium parmentieri]AFI89918.1 11.6 kDa putative exported protein [Pectobacterium parmentieri]MBI0469324.1 hypothetical protein [Pectobacterium parmentieri]MBI0491948.1 hypothetical protein [Pectobacterium parmentieri]MBI0553232.1 hypothetical protein [Pectobacterium parmentieri]MBI0566371.1 hypothetical protein [Pectobacterium parmentieri]